MTNERMAQIISEQEKKLKLARETIILIEVLIKGNQKDLERLKKEEKELEVFIEQLKKE